MPPELRKRKVPESSTDKPPPKKSNSAKQASANPAGAKSKKAPVAKPEDAEINGSAKVTVGDYITLADFGGEIETQDGEKTSLQKLVEKSEKGVVLFTYPRASTPGCTFASISCKGLFLINYRHNPSLPLPRLLRVSQG
jgi:peroxiredoxin Q/BCP